MNKGDNDLEFIDVGSSSSQLNVPTAQINSYTEQDPNTMGPWLYKQSKVNCYIYNIYLFIF